MKKLLALIASAFVLSASVGFAQQSVHLRGKVEDGEGVCYYCPGFDFVIDCTEIPISSSIYDLNVLVGEQVEAWGVFNGSTTAPQIDITLLEVVPESFSIGGGGSIGGPIDFTFHGSQGDAALIAGALGSSLSLFGTDAFFLGMNSLVLLGSGSAGGDGEVEVTIELPNEPSLVGLEVFGQAFVVPASGAPAYFTNLDCKTLSM